MSLTPSDIPPADNICIARQPILDRSKQLVAYELLFRSLDGRAALPIDGLHTTLSVIHNTFHGLGIEAVLGNVPGFINVDADFLMSDLVDALPIDQVVLEVLETVDPSAALIQRVRDLKKRGFKFALDDYTGDDARYKVLMPELDYFKVDLMQVPFQRLDGIVNNLRQHSGKLLAEKVETVIDFRRAMSARFDLYQGFHFAHPELMSGSDMRVAPPTDLLKLLTLLIEEADTRFVVAELKRQPALSYNLIRIANSAAIGASQKISSIQEAALLLGHRQLLHVVQVLLYASQGGNAENNPLLQMAMVRSKLMEDVASTDTTLGPDYPDVAFLTGMLSLLDVLLQMPLDDILEDLPIAEPIREALLFRSGKLGHLLKLCEHLDQQDSRSIERELDDIPSMQGHNLMAMQLDAFSWAQNLGL